MDDGASDRTVSTSVARTGHESRREAAETEGRRGFSQVRATQAYPQRYVKEAERENPRRSRGSADAVEVHEESERQTKGGRPVSTGILRSSGHVELLGSRKTSGKMQLPIKNWHSQLN